MTAETEKLIAEAQKAIAFLNDECNTAARGFPMADFEHAISVITRLAAALAASEAARVEAEQERDASDVALLLTYPHPRGAHVISSNWEHRPTINAALDAARARQNEPSNG